MLRQDQALNVAQERSFLESSLPRTMALASRHRPRILPLLSRVGAAWPFEDRVLVWLADHWREDVMKYHARHSGSMSERFVPDQLEHFDEHYLETLRQRLQSIGVVA